MKEISPDAIVRRIQLENPWWGAESRIAADLLAMHRRAYFKLLFPLVKERDPRRAVVVMGPRRVGKTVLLQHIIQALIDDGVEASHIGYFSVDHPIYNGLGLEELFEQYQRSTGIDPRTKKVFLFFDEIQYLRNWEVHLKSAIDSYPNAKIVVSGSAAAALRLKSNESGAGRFTSFLLPPLTFFEFIELTGKDSLLTRPSDLGFFETSDIAQLNWEFVNYLNYGGYPEAIFSAAIRSDPQRFIKSDIIDKVLLRDLPSLYGIADIQELNSLFTMLAYNTANEVSLEDLARKSGVAKTTIKRYIEYLEAAFLIKIVHRVDQNARRFQRANFFKVYLTNPSMRAALFSPALESDAQEIGHLAETAIFSQWFHSDETLFYARWEKGTVKGEVDIVLLDEATQKPEWVVEVKWSDKYCSNPNELGALLAFCRKNGLEDVTVTSKTRTLWREEQEIRIEFVPASLYCYTVGYNLVHGKGGHMVTNSVPAVQQGTRESSPP